MSRRGTLLVVVALTLVGVAVAIGVDVLDDGEGATNGASPPGPGDGACGDPPTVVASFDMRDGEPQVFLVRAGAEPTSLTPGELSSGPAVSPDGRRVAFVRPSYDYSSSSPQSAIATVGLDGSDPEDLTPLGPTTDEDPAWSPDGRTIALSRSELVGEVFTRSVVTVPAAGGEPTTILTDATGLVRFEALAWSPEGDRLAVVRQTERPDGLDIATAVLLVDAEGGPPTELATIDEASSLDWSPDGTRLLAATRGAEVALSVIDVATGAVEAVDAELTGARWAPDGDRVVGGRGLGGELVLADLDGGPEADEVLLSDDAFPTGRWDDPTTLASPWGEIAVVPCPPPG